MERSYIAFISYRHLPLEMATAKKLHKRIEHYVIPAELRKGGKKKLGLVFRDQDELPTSSNLSANIRLALDRSKYLIVICTPETSKSPWVLREITYFLEHHDHDHVLAVLADGTPDEAFPQPLTELRSESGDLLEQIEPLAANIVADSDAKRARLFRVESLRILAALIGCPFDALYKREQRFRRRRTAIALGTVAVIAAAFIGMLLNRNAEIRAQLQRTLISESKTLAALSEQAYLEGDYDGALRYALQALPGEERERPYVAEAEFALSRELDLYRQNVLCYARSLEQDSPIALSALSDDGAYLATADEYGVLRCFDLATGERLWEHRGGLIYYIQFLEQNGSLLVLSKDGIAACNIKTGDSLWQRNDLAALDLVAITDNEKNGLLNSLFAGDGQTELFSLLDLESGQTLNAATSTGKAARLCATAALTDDLRYAVMLLRRADGSAADLVLWQANGFELVKIAEDLPFSPGSTAYKVMFRDNGDILLACDNHNGQSSLRLFTRGSNYSQRFEIPVDTEKVIMQSGAGADPFPSVDLLDCVGDRAVFGCKHDLYMIDLSVGDILWHKSLSGFLLSAKLYANACMGLVLSDGTVSFCTDSGFLSDDAGIYNFRCGYDLSSAVITGESFPESRVVLIPSAFTQRAALIRFVDNPKMKKIGAFDSNVSRVAMVSSPSGELVLCLGYDPTGLPVEALLLNDLEGSSDGFFPLTLNGGWEDPGQLFLTEDGKLISPRGVLDVFSRDFTEAASGELVSAVDLTGKTVVTASLSSDATQTLRLYADGAESASRLCPSGKWQIEAVGGCGYVLLRDESGKLTLCSPTGDWSALNNTDGSAFSLGGECPLLAAWNGERLVIRDLASGKVTQSGTLPATTVKLLFTYGDEELIAFSETGEFCVIRCSDGELLCRAQLSELGIHFHASGARYSIKKAEKEDRLLIFYDDLTRNAGICLVYDRESGSLAGAYDAVAAYLPESNCVAVAPMMDGVYLSPFRSRAEIIKEAESLVG